MNPWVRDKHYLPSPRSAWKLFLCLQHLSLSVEEAQWNRTHKSKKKSSTASCSWAVGLSANRCLCKWPWAKVHMNTQEQSSAYVSVLCGLPPDWKTSTEIINLLVLFYTFYSVCVLNELALCSNLFCPIWFIPFCSCHAMAGLRPSYKSCDIEYLQFFDKHENDSPCLNSEGHRGHCFLSFQLVTCCKHFLLPWHNPLSPLSHVTLHPMPTTVQGNIFWSRLWVVWESKYMGGGIRPVTEPWNVTEQRREWLNQSVSQSFTQMTQRACA